MGWPITHESVIYCIRCKANGKVYIGRTYNLKRRIAEHFSALRRGQKRCFASDRYGASGWQFTFGVSTAIWVAAMLLKWVTSHD